MDKLSCDQLMLKIQECEFVCVELNEYLDTHPDDVRARVDYNCYSKHLKALKHRYECAYGPLHDFGNSQWDSGSWVCSPWPWEAR